jgi:hypothetical protein
MKRYYIQPAIQVTNIHSLSVLMVSGGFGIQGKVGNIPPNTPLYWATIGAGPGADACTGV